MNVKANIPYELNSTHFKSKPYPISQNRCLIPAKKWYQIPQSEKNIINLPIADLKKVEKWLKISSPNNKETKKPIIAIRLIDKAMPDILCKIDRTEFICGL